MKKITTIAFALAVVLNVNAQKQKGQEKHKNATELDLKKDIKVTSKGVVKKSKGMALAKVALEFKTISKNSVYIGKGQKTSKSSAYAILGGVSEATMQSIADEFAASFTKKLEALNIPVKDWSTITSSEKWEKVTSKQIDKIYQKQEEGLMEIFTANNGPHTKQVVGNMGIWGAYAKLGKDIGANPVTLDVVIDFANFNMSLKKSVSSTGYFDNKEYTTTYASNANVFPQISIETDNGGAGFNLLTTNMTVIGKYGEASIITLNKNVLFNGAYATSVDAYNGKMPTQMKKKISFGQGMSVGTFIIQANEAAYKKAVLDALDIYSDYIIEKIRLIRTK